MYWANVILRWLDYTALILVAVIIANILLIAVSLVEPNGIVSLAFHAQGNKVIALILFGPFINLYAWYKSAYFFSEAEDDIFIRTKPAPKPPEREFVIRIFPLLPGIFLFPVALWFYTMSSETLWPVESLLKPGVFLAWLGLGTSTFLAQKFLPGFKRKLRKRVSSKLRNKFT